MRGVDDGLPVGQLLHDLVKRAQRLAPDDPNADRSDDLAGDARRYYYEHTDSDGDSFIASLWAWQDLDQHQRQAWVAQPEDFLDIGGVVGREGVPARWQDAANRWRVVHRLRALQIKAIVEPLSEADLAEVAALTDAVEQLEALEDSAGLFDHRVPVYLVFFDPQTGVIGLSLGEPDVADTVVVDVIDGMPRRTGNAGWYLTGLHAQRVAGEDTGSVASMLFFGPDLKTETVRDQVDHALRDRQRTRETYYNRRPGLQHPTASSKKERWHRYDDIADEVAAVADRAVDAGHVGVPVLDPLRTAELDGHPLDCAALVCAQRSARAEMPRCWIVRCSRTEVAIADGWGLGAPRNVRLGRADHGVAERRRFCLRVDRPGRSSRKPR